MMQSTAIFVHSNNRVVADFIAQYKSLIFSACGRAKLRRCDWDDVLNRVAEKFVRGKLYFNPAKGHTFEAYLYAVAMNCAKDIKRGAVVYWDNGDDGAAENICDSHNIYRQIEAGDEKKVVVEALKRLSKEMRDQAKLEMLVRYVINGEPRQDLAREYGVDDDYVSLVKSRYLPRLQALVREVLRADSHGSLTLSNSDIRFLRPYMRNW